MKNCNEQHKENFKLKIRELDLKFNNLENDYDINTIIDNLDQLDGLQQEIMNSIKLDELTKTVLCANIIKIKAKDFLLFSKNDSRSVKIGSTSEFKKMFTKDNKPVEAYVHFADYTEKNFAIFMDCYLGNQKYDINMSGPKLQTFANPTLSDTYNSIFEITERYYGEDYKLKFLQLSLDAQNNGRFKEIMHGIRGCGGEDICLGGEGIIIDFNEENGINTTCRVKKFDDNLNKVATLDYLLDGSGCIINMSPYSNNTYNYIDGKLKYISDDKNRITLNMMGRLSGKYLKSYIKRTNRLPLTCDKISDMDLTSRM